MSKFPTYSMAGIGIAAAMGFVFVLSYFNNAPVIDTGDEKAELFQDQSSSEPSSALLQKEEDSQGMRAGEAPKTPSTEEDASLMMDAQPTALLQPTLVSIVALDGTTGETIGEVLPGMQFQANKPVFIKATFMNDNDAAISNHLIAMGIGSGNNSSTISMQDQQASYEEAATFRGDIKSNGKVELELNWSPARIGDYEIMLFSTTPEALTTDENIRPIESIAVSVVEGIG